MKWVRGPFILLLRQFWPGARISRWADRWRRRSAAPTPSPSPPIPHTNNNKPTFREVKKGEIKIMHIYYFLECLVECPHGDEHDTPHLAYIRGVPSDTETDKQYLMKKGTLSWSRSCIGMEDAAAPTWMPSNGACSLQPCQPSFVASWIWLDSSKSPSLRRLQDAIIKLDESNGPLWTWDLIPAF